MSPKKCAKAKKKKNVWFWRTIRLRFFTVKISFYLFHYIIFGDPIHVCTYVHRNSLKLFFFNSQNIRLLRVKIIIELRFFFSKICLRTTIFFLKHKVSTTYLWFRFKFAYLKEYGNKTTIFNRIHLYYYGTHMRTK